MTPGPLSSFRRRQAVTALAAAIGASLAWLRWENTWTLALAVVAFFLLLLALLAPRKHAPVFHVLEWLVQKLLQGLSWCLLGVVFLGIFLPGRILLLAARRDVLAQRPDASRSSYWETPMVEDGDKRFERQF